MPLWEGWDEPYHFGCVQQIANGQGVPDAENSRLTEEVNDSLPPTPASYIVRRNNPRLITFQEYFALPLARRQAMRRTLWSISPMLRWQRSAAVDYEGLQAPLAYAAMALPERLLWRVPLPERVAWLRVLAAIAGSLLLLAGAARLMAELGVPAPSRDAALFCLLSVQTIWAVLAHIGNDGVAVVISIWAVVALVRYWSRPSVRTAIAAALLIAAGLLTKAHFLALAPAPFVLCVLRRRWRDVAVTVAIYAAVAGPWYARNLARYGDLSGTMESRGGVGVLQVARQAVKLPWPTILDHTLLTSLWTGNNSFTSFSSITLHAIVVLWAAGLVLALRGRHGPAERVVWFYCALFWVALAYAAVADNLTSGGEKLHPQPWYTQMITAPMLCLAFLGMARASRAGRVLAAGCVLVFGYVLAATYAVKLVPLYGGYDGRTSLSAVWALYTRHGGMLTANLDTVALAPSAVIYAGTVVVVVLAGGLGVGVIRGLSGGTERGAAEASGSALQS